MERYGKCRKSREGRRAGAGAGAGAGIRAGVGRVRKAGRIVEKETREDVWLRNEEQKGYQRKSISRSKKERNVKRKDAMKRKKMLTIWTKYLLDFMFYAGIAVTATLPLGVKLIGARFPHLIEHYEESVIIYFVLGIAALVLVRELRKIFRTVLAEDCFVQENVESLRKMGNWSFIIALMSVVRSIVYFTVAMSVVILVFVIAGLFSKVLSYVFEEAVRYKEENDLTV